MIHAQALGKRKAHSISDVGAVTESALPGDGATSSIAAAALVAVRTIRSSASKTSRECAAINVKKAVIEMHSLLDVALMLRNKDVLSTQRCARPLRSLPVGMLDKYSREHAVALKARSFLQGGSILSQASAEASRSAEERRQYAAGCSRLRDRWELSVLKPSTDAPASLRHDVALVNCSYSSCGGKYDGDQWAETLAIHATGISLRKSKSTSPLYTIEACVYHLQRGKLASTSLWELLGERLNTMDGQCAFDKNLDRIELDLQRKRHDSLCREIFDKLTVEALEIAAKYQAVSLNTRVSRQEPGYDMPDISLHDEKLVAQLQIIHFSRLKMSFLLSDCTALSFELIQNPSESDYASTETNEDAKGGKGLSAFIISIRASVSLALLTMAFRTIRDLRSGNDTSTAQKKSGPIELRR